MYQNYNYYPTTITPQTPYQYQPGTGSRANVPVSQMPPYNNGGAGVLKGHPVSSLDEAKVASIDFDGSIFFFPDPANKRIYTKQINLDGTSTLNVYELKEIPIDTGNYGQYITREEFEYAISQLKEGLASTQQITNSSENQRSINNF